MPVSLVQCISRVDFPVSVDVRWGEGEGEGEREKERKREGKKNTVNIKFQWSKEKEGRRSLEISPVVCLGIAAFDQRN